MTIGVRWLLNILVYTVFTVGAFAVGSTGWPGKWLVQAAEWVSGEALGSHAPGSPGEASEDAADAAEGMGARHDS